MIRSIDTIVEKFENNLFEKMCPKNYLAIVISDINDDSLLNLKLTLERSIEFFIGNLISSSKVYVYKFGLDVKIEILINPIESSTILEYHVLVKREGEYTITKVR